MREYEDLWFEAAETCADVGRPAEAEVFYTALLDAPEYDTPELWRKIAACIRARNRGSSEDAAFVAAASAEAAIAFYRSALERHPSSLDAKLPLAEALISRGRSREAAEVLPTAEELATMRKTDAIRVLALRRKAGGDETFLEVALPMVKNALETDATTTNAAPEEARGGVREPRRKIYPRRESIRGRTRRRAEGDGAGGGRVHGLRRDRRRPEKRARTKKPPPPPPPRRTPATADVAAGGLPSIGLEDEGAFVSRSVAHAHCERTSQRRAASDGRGGGAAARRRRAQIPARRVPRRGRREGAADAAKEVTLAYRYWRRRGRSTPPPRNPAGSKSAPAARRLITSNHPEFTANPNVSPRRWSRRARYSYGRETGAGVGGPRARVRARARLPVYGAAAGVAALHHASRPGNLQNFTRVGDRRRRAAARGEALGGDGTRAGGVV